MITYKKTKAEQARAQEGRELEYNAEKLKEDNAFETAHAKQRENIATGVITYKNEKEKQKRAEEARQLEYGAEKLTLDNAFETAHAKEREDLSAGKIAMEKRIGDQARTLAGNRLTADITELRAQETHQKAYNPTIVAIEKLRAEAQSRQGANQRLMDENSLGITHETLKGVPSAENDPLSKTGMVGYSA
jgi:hypothetical protein